MSAINPEWIELEVDIRASYTGTRIAGPCLVDDQVTLKVPYGVDPKYINLGKVMEGVILSVVERHKNKVLDAAGRKNDESQLQLWGSGAYSTYAAKEVGHKNGSIGGEKVDSANLTIEDQDGHVTEVTAEVVVADPVYVAVDGIVSWIKKTIPIGDHMQTAEEIRLDLVGKLEERDSFWFERMVQEARAIEEDVDLNEVLALVRGILTEEVLNPEQVTE